jgi:hypothetical protein
MQASGRSPPRQSADQSQDKDDDKDRSKHVSLRIWRQNCTSWTFVPAQSSSGGVSLAMLQNPRLVVTLFALLASSPGVCETSEEKPAATMRDVQAHFRACLTPFHEADGSQITVYFSVKRNGQVFGRPRAVWFGSNVKEEDRKKILSDFIRAFRNCTPLQLDHRMAEGIAGSVYFLQFKGAAAGPEVVVRPFGSEGPPLVEGGRW